MSPGTWAGGVFLDEDCVVSRDFSSGPVVKNPPSNAGVVDLIPGQGIKISHAMGQLSLHATTTELVRLN